VTAYVDPETFEELASWARRMGFVHVLSGPLVRSSYKAAEVGA
jgi:lipoyl synthase